MRPISFIALLLAAACATTPRPVAPTTATVFLAPVVCSPYVKDGLPRDLVAEFDRRLRLAIDMKQVGAEDEADYVVQAVLTFADVKITESKLSVATPIIYWDEVLIGSITVTARTDPIHPVVVPVPSSSGPSWYGYSSVQPSIAVLLKSMRGCRVDPVSGDVTTRDGKPAWMPGVKHVIGLGTGNGIWLCDSLGLPSKPLPDPPWRLVESPEEEWARERMREFTDKLTTKLEVYSGGIGRPFYWARTAPVLQALISREQLRDEKLDAEDLRLLSSILDRIAHEVGDDGPWEDRWGIESYAELCRWLVARMRDDYDAFRTGYKVLLAKDIEPEFCKAIYTRWPPKPDVFRNPYTR